MSVTLQESCNKAMTKVFDTFGREQKVVFYKEPQESVVYLDNSWNADFQRSKPTNINKTVVKKEIFCRLWWFDNNELIKSIDGDENLSIKLSYPLARIKLQIRAEDFGWLKDSKAFYVFGEKFIKDSDWRGLGILQQINFYEIVLKKNQ